MRLPLLLIHKIDHDQFNNWALLLPPIRSIFKLAAFAAACMPCRPQRHISPFVLAKTNLARARTKSYCLSQPQLALICANSSIASMLALRLAASPLNSPPPQKRDNVGPIRSRAGGMQLLTSLAPQDLYAVDYIGQAAGGCGIESSASTFSDIRSFSSCASMDDVSGSSGSDSSSGSCDGALERTAGGRTKRRKQ